MREPTKDLLWRRTWVTSFHFRLTASCVISGTSGPKTDLNCLPSSSSHCHCFVFIVRQILPVVFPCERQTNSPAGCRMLTVLPFSHNAFSLSLESSVCFACELHVYGHFFGMSLPVSVHVCSCCSGVNWKATTEVAFFYLAHKKLNSQALPIVVVIACVAHTPRPQNVARLCGLLQRGSGLKWNFVGNCKSDLNVCRCFYFFFCWVYFELDREICEPS